MITEERLAELEALEKGATPAPWLVTRESGQGWLIATIEGEDKRQVNVVTNGAAPGIETFPEADATLITEARNALPELLAEVRRLRGVLEEIAAIVTTNSHWTEPEQGIARICRAALESVGESQKKPRPLP